MELEETFEEEEIDPEIIEQVDNQIYEVINKWLFDDIEELEIQLSKIHF